MQEDTGTDYLNEVHEDKLTKNCGDAKQSQPITNIENCVFQGEFSSKALHIDNELQSICLQWAILWFQLLSLTIIPCIADFF